MNCTNCKFAIWPTMSSDLIKHTSDASFDTDVLKSTKPVLVDYWAWTVMLMGRPFRPGGRG